MRKITLGTFVSTYILPSFKIKSFTCIKQSHTHIRGPINRRMPHILEVRLNSRTLQGLLYISLRMRMRLFTGKCICRHCFFKAFHPKHGGSATSTEGVTEGREQK